MRVLFVLHTYPPDAWGGTELHVRNVAHVLAKNHAVRVFCASSDPLAQQDEITREADGDIEVVRFHNHFDGYESFQWTWAYPPADAAFRQQIEEFRPDVVHIHHLTGLSTTIIHAAKEAGLPTLFSLHDFWTVCPRGQRLHPDGDICETIDRDRCRDCVSRIWPHWFPADREIDAPENDLAYWDEAMAETLGLADLLLTPSAFHRERMLEQIPSLDPSRCIANAHGLDHSGFPRREQSSDKVRVIGFIGTVIRTKGVHVLTHAFDRLNAPGIELRIHGDTPAFHENAEYVTLLKEQSRGQVRFLGHYDNDQLPAILAEVDILVVPSLWWETFSLTIREAMIAGVPVVASDLGAMREAIETQGGGLLFRAGDDEDLARVLRRLIENDALRDSLAGSRDRVKTIEDNAADYLTLYERARKIAGGDQDETVNKPSFPRRRNRRSEKEPITDSPIPSEPDDVDISIERVGEGEVTVQSAVFRDEGTRVSFSLDYPADGDPSEVRIVVDFRRQSARLIPADKETPAAPIPSDADSGAAGMVRAHDGTWDEEMRERAMYMMDDEIAVAHADRMDDLVDASTLSDEDKDLGKSADETPAEPAPKRRRRSRERKESAEAAPAQEKKPQRERRPKKKPSKKPSEKGSDEVVWEGENNSWSLPTSSSDEASGEKPERAPNHRLGRQPGLGGAREGDFGEGLSGK